MQLVLFSSFFLSLLFYLRAVFPLSRLFFSSRTKVERIGEHLNDTKWTINLERKVEEEHHTHRQIATVFMASSRTGKYCKDSLLSSFITTIPGHLCCIARKRERRPSSNTIESGLMEIKTPYRIPHVSQMAALDGVGYKHQPSLGLFTCFFLESP